MRCYVSSVAPFTLLCFHLNRRYSTDITRNETLASYIKCCHIMSMCLEVKRLLVEGSFSRHAPFLANRHAKTYFFGDYMDFSLFPDPKPYMSIPNPNPGQAQTLHCELYIKYSQLQLSNAMQMITFNFCELKSFNNFKLLVYFTFEVILKI